MKVRKDTFNISRIENVDPYTLKKENLNFDTECFSKISYPDIVNYLLFAPSPVTAEELKCYKSIEAYNYFLCGWVKEIATKSFKDESCVILGKVSKFYSFKSSKHLHGYYKKYLTISTFLLIKRKKHYCIYVKQLQGHSFLQLIEKGLYMQFNASKFF